MEYTTGYVPLQAEAIEEAEQVPFIPTIRLGPEPHGFSMGKRSGNRKKKSPVETLPWPPEEEEEPRKFNYVFSIHSNETI